MAISLIAGAPGSGKSYEAVAFHILPAVRQGRKVITNIPINLGFFRKIDPGFDLNLVDVYESTLEHPIRFKHISDYEDDWKSDKGVGPLYVIDECHNCFPRSVRGAAAKENEEQVFRWLTMHRHYGADVVLITQQVGQMNRDIPGLAEVYYILQKNRLAFGSSTTYRQTSKDGYRGTTLGTTLRKYDKRVFPYYKSQTLGGAAEANIKTKPIWFKWPFLLFYGLIVYNVYVGLFTDNWTKVLSFGLDKGSKHEAKAPPQAVHPPLDTDLALPAAVTHAEDRSLMQQGSSVLASPAQSLFKREPEEPQQVDGFDPRRVLDVEWVRLGDRCGFKLKLDSGRQLRGWEIGQAGWQVALHVHDGEDRTRFGACSLDLVREIEGTIVVASYYMEPSMVFTLDTLRPLAELPVVAPALDAVTAPYVGMPESASITTPSGIAPSVLLAPNTPTADPVSVTPKFNGDVDARK